MAIDFSKTSAETMLKLAAAANKQDTSRPSFSPLTPEGQKRGVSLFNLEEFVDDQVLIYLPNMGVDPELGIYPVQVNSNTLYVPGKDSTAKGSYRGVVRSTLGLAGGEAVWGQFGISTEAPFFRDYLSKASEYVNLRCAERYIRDFGTDDRNEISADKAKEIYIAEAKYNPIGGGSKDKVSKTTHFIPAVVIYTERNPETKKRGLKPEIVQVDGKNTFHFQHVWFRANDEVLEKLRKATTQLSEDGSRMNPEGFLYRFDYTITDEAREKAKNANSQFQDEKSLSGKSLAIQAIDRDSKQGALYKTFEGAKSGSFLARWDEKAQADYNYQTLAVDVVEAELLTDEEFEAKLDAVLKPLDKLIEQQKLKNKALKNGTFTEEVQEEGSIDSVLAGDGSPLAIETSDKGGESVVEDDDLDI